MSNTGHNRARSDINEEASRWVARLYSGNASQADEEALELWLNENTAHEEAYASMLALWDTTAGADPDEAKVTDKPQIAGKRLFAGFAAVAMLMVVMVVTLSSGTHRSPSDMQVSSYSAPVGETRDVVLDDGTRVTLNTGSRLLVDFSGSMRRAILDSGEAFFDVERDPTRPFVVTAGLQSVTVLGTKFNVQRKGQKLTVAVLEGVVAVHENVAPERLEENAHVLFSQKDDALADPGFTHYRLEAGSVGTFEKSAELVTEVAAADAVEHQTWRKGVVSFTDARLADVIAELGRYTTKQLIVDDAVVADLKISGVFHYADLPGVYAGLEAMLPVDVVERGDHVIIRTAEVTPE